MRRNSLSLYWTVFVLFLLMVGSDAFYTVDETQQVVITQFGEPIGSPITQSGLKMKLPWVQKINAFEKRLLQWDGEPTRVNTVDKRYIWIDITARWRIADALKFMKSVGSERYANEKLDKVVNSGTREIVRKLDLTETVRNTNYLFDQEQSKHLARIAAGSTLSRQNLIEKIELGREMMSREILKQAAKTVADLGIELVDVRIKRISYTAELRNDVYITMISEREQAAEQFRSEGMGKKAEIEGQMKKELDEVLSQAYRQVQEIRGQADAEAIGIYAEAYNKDPEFYDFLKTLETYRKTTNKDHQWILSTNSHLYKYIKGMKQEKLQAVP
jgi:membrane protease subunit HflC